MRPDVAIVGAPFDDAVSYRPGARFGPRAIRRSDLHPGRVLPPAGRRALPRCSTWSTRATPTSCPAWLDRGHAMIFRKVLEVAASGAIPIVLGGDHSITWPSASAVAQARAPGSIGIVHFDAHADTADSDWGVLAGHGTPMRRLIESGAVKGRNFVQVGLRGYWPPPDVFEWMKAQGMRWHLMREIEERGAEAVVDDAIAEALDGPDAIYLSVDIDVIDPGMAPGTGTPEPGGMLTRELLRAVRRIVGTVELAGDGRGRGGAAVRPRRGHGHGRPSGVLGVHQRAGRKKQDGGRSGSRVAWSPSGQGSGPPAYPRTRTRLTGRRIRPNGNAPVTGTTPTAGPSSPHADAKARIASIVEAHRAEILDVSHRIHADPEPAFEEHRAAEPGRRCRPAPRLCRSSIRRAAWPTAVRGRLAGGLGADGPRIGILAEYDALPGLGHGCGHNLDGGQRRRARPSRWPTLAPEISGEIVFLGTPAEERGSGKQIMIDDGLFDGLDAALLFHPCDRTHIGCALLASEDVEVTFTGLQAHAAADPWKGRNALDALVLLFSVGRAVAPAAAADGARPRHRRRGRHGRQHHSRADGRPVHGPQPRPGRVTTRMQARFRDLVQAAALAADCEAEVVFSGASIDDARQRRAARPCSRPTDGGRRSRTAPIRSQALGSSDMGNVSQVLPTIHPCLAICDGGRRRPLHGVPRRRRDAPRRRGDACWPRPWCPDRVGPVRRAHPGRGRVARVPRVAGTTDGIRPPRTCSRATTTSTSSDDPGDLPLYLALAERTGGPVLELAAGTGRLAVPLAAAGHEVTAVDNDPHMLARAEALVVGQRPAPTVALAGAGRG